MAGQVLLQRKTPKRSAADQVRCAGQGEEET